MFQGPFSSNFFFRFLPLAPEIVHNLCELTRGNAGRRPPAPLFFFSPLSSRSLVTFRGFIVAHFFSSSDSTHQFFPPFFPSMFPGIQTFCHFSDAIPLSRLPLQLLALFLEFVAYPGSLLSKDSYSQSPRGQETSLYSCCSLQDWLFFTALVLRVPYLGLQILGSSRDLTIFKF